MYVRDEHSRPRNEVHLIFRSNLRHSNQSTAVIWLRSTCLCGRKHVMMQLGAEWGAERKVCVMCVHTGLFGL